MPLNSCILWDVFDSVRLTLKRRMSIVLTCLIMCITSRGHPEGGPTGFSKKIKTPFFRDIEKSFQEVAPIGPEPHQFFLFLKYLNKYDR